jgi:phage regulator Rha-like protein
MGSTLLTKEKQTASNSINLIIQGRTNQLCVDSREIAKEFGRQHKNVLQTLDDLLADGTISQLEAKPREYQKRGRAYRCFELNKAGFLKSMPFIGGAKSREGQRRLVDEFLKIEAALEKQSKERETLAFHVARSSGKDARAILTDTIQQFIEYAKGQGSQNAERYFKNISNAVYAAMLVIEPKANAVRELLSAIQLSTLATAELIAAQALIEGMDKQQPYKKIFQSVKVTLNAFFSGQKSQILGS